MTKDKGQTPDRWAADGRTNRHELDNLEARRARARYKARYGSTPDEFKSEAKQFLVVWVVVFVVALVLGIGFVLFQLVSATSEIASSVTGSAATSAEPDVVVTEEEAPDLSTLAGLLQAGKVSSIRVIGDSITAGYLTDGADKSNDTVIYGGPLGTYYETSHEARCWANAFREYAVGRGVSTFVNAGVSGFRMQFLAEAPDAWLGEGADVIVVMLGTNDAAKESIEDFEAYARTALAAAAGRCDHLVVVSPPNNERTDAQNRYGLDQIDEVLTRVCAEEGYEHVSLYDALDLYSDDFNPDQVHPTSAGSLKLWEALRVRLDL